jgi:rubrerythrin
MFVFGTADDVFAMAIRIEENGKAFYAGSAERTASPKLKSLFKDLSEMEDRHITQFKDMRRRLASSFPSESIWDPEGLAESYLQAAADTHVFTVEAAEERLKTVNTSMEALDVALMFEKDSVAFFIGMKEMLPDPGGKGDIDSLIRAEMDHIRLLSAAKKALSE